VLVNKIRWELNESGKMKKYVLYLLRLRQSIEHGMSRRLNTVWKQKRPLCPESHSSIPTPVNVHDFSPALIMITAAYSFSICLLLMENLMKKFTYKSYGLSSFIHYKQKIHSTVKSFKGRNVLIETQ
jgi:hypothetical protein